MLTAKEYLTPREIVNALDKYIVGQQEAKRNVAIALRNRWRRMHVPAAVRGDITPNNILMIGATGVGKTEIARRLAKLANAPFLKVEATKFTEVGYVGRDVESIVLRVLRAQEGASLPGHRLSAPCSLLRDELLLLRSWHAGTLLGTGAWLSCHGASTLESCALRGRYGAEFGLGLRTVELGAKCQRKLLGRPTSLLSALVLPV